jgi:hypothetical protein
MVYRNDTLGAAIARETVSGISNARKSHHKYWVDGCVDPSRDWSGSQYIGSNHAAQRTDSDSACES